MPGQNAFPTFGPLAAIRKGAGCTETQNNGTDFVLAPPALRNSQTALAPCSQAPVINTGGIVNAATLQAGPIAPGELLTILGSYLGPTGVSVTFDGVVAPILYSAYGQINLIAPYEIARKSSTSMAVQVNALSSTAITLPVAASSPGIFTTAGSGYGQAAALNKDGSLNGADHPAAPGDYVVLYATGAGQSPGALFGDGVVQNAAQALPSGLVTVRDPDQPATVLCARPPLAS